MTETAHWRTCSSCKKEIGFAKLYYVCSVSTCTRKPTDLRFCGVECWDAHVPVMRHRDAWAEERRSPTEAEWAREQLAASAPPASSPPRGAAEAAAPRRIVVSNPTVSAKASDAPREILIVVSKLKAYVRARSGMNTSDGVMDVLSDRVRALCDAAIDNATAAGRKTVLDRDF
jgi:hypothetical protein